MNWSFNNQDIRDLVLTIQKHFFILVIKYVTISDMPSDSCEQNSKSGCLRNFPKHGNLLEGSHIIRRHLYVYFIYLFLNWSKIALQCCVSFWCTVKWISYMYTYIPSLLDLPPTPHPTHLGCHSTVLSSQMSILTQVNTHTYWILRCSVVFHGEQHGRIFLQVNLASKPGVICKSIDSASRQEQLSYLEQVLTVRRRHL